MIQVLVPIADGVEEMEAVIAIDVMRRAQWDVCVAGLKEGAVTASRRVRLVPDIAWDAIDPASFDVIVIPGGAGGVDILRRDDRVLSAVRNQAGAGKYVAAICAGPLVLQAAGILDGRRVTSHPSVAAQITACERVDDPVVVDGRVITSQGPGTSFDFALTLVRELDGAEQAVKLAQAMIYT